MIFFSTRTTEFDEKPKRGRPCGKVGSRGATRGRGRPPGSTRGRGRPPKLKVSTDNLEKSPVTDNLEKFPPTPIIKVRNINEIKENNLPYNTGYVT